jgi:hypothetical protein
MQHIDWYIEGVEVSNCNYFHFNAIRQSGTGVVR